MDRVFHQRLPPAIIDLSPYWRPPAFADAVVVADAMAWEGADAELPAVAGGGRADDWQAPYRPAVRTACDLAADADKR